MGIVCILVGLDVLVLTVWEFTDPLKIVRYNKTLEIIVSIPDPAPIFHHTYRDIHLRMLSLN